MGDRKYQQTGERLTKNLVKKGEALSAKPRQL